MAAVDRELHARIGLKGRLGGIENVDKCDPAFRRHIAGGGPIGCKFRIPGGGHGQERITRLLDGDRCNDHEPGRSLGVITRVGLREFIQERVVVLLEPLHSTGTGERFIEAEEQQHRVSAEGGERIVELRVVARPLSLADLISRPGEVANHKLLVRKPLVKERLEMSK